MRRRIERGFFMGLWAEIRKLAEIRQPEPRKPDFGHPEEQLSGLHREQIKERPLRFIHQETREEGGSDHLRLGEIYFRRGGDRFQDGDNCLVYINDRIRSADDRGRSINNQDAFENDRLRLRNDYLQDGQNRFSPANNYFRCGDNYFVRRVRNSLIRGDLMFDGNNRFCYGNNYLRLGNSYL